MTDYLLDTQHIGALQRATEPGARLRDRMKAAKDATFAVSIVSFHEEVQGWMAHLNRKQKQSDVVFGYKMLHDLLGWFQRLTVLLYDDILADEFERLKALASRVGTLDLRIGATAIVHNRIILTNNFVDFERMPGVRCEDWTVDPPPRNLIRD